MWGEVCGFCCVSVVFKRDISFILLFHYLAFMRDSDICIYIFKHFGVNDALYAKKTLFTLAFTPPPRGVGALLVYIFKYSSEQ